MTILTAFSFFGSFVVIFLPEKRQFSREERELEDER